MFNVTPKQTNEASILNKATVAELKTIWVTMNYGDRDSFNEIFPETDPVKLKRQLIEAINDHRWILRIWQAAGLKPAAGLHAIEEVPEKQRYLIDSLFLKLALKEAESCRNVQFYGVGCFIWATNGVSHGYTGELTHLHNGEVKMRHAEEVAIMRAKNTRISLAGATLYTTLEPCSERLSGLTSCTSHIIESGISRVVFGTHEAYDPKIGIKCKGAKILAEAGIKVIHHRRFEQQCRESILRGRNRR
jgi:pyrimidine deaminase RibD-like protein